MGRGARVGILCLSTLLPLAAIGCGGDDHAQDGAPSDGLPGVDGAASDGAASDATPGADGGVWASIPKDRLIFLANRVDPGSSPPELYLLERSGEIQMLVDDSYRNYNPSIAPSGLEIAFHRQLGDSFSTIEIFTRNVSTGDETRITNNDFADVAPKWSPDGSKLVFASWSNEGVASSAANLFVVDSLGTLTQITHDTDAENMDPSWCGPDEIVFKSTTLANDSKEQIYLIAADGSGSRTQLSQQSGWQSDHDPRCTPDGSKVFFYRYDASRPWKDLYDPVTLSQHWQDFYPVNVWTNSTSGAPGDQEMLTDCAHSCPYPIPATNGTIGFLHQDFITDADDYLIGSTTHFTVMNADGSEQSELLSDSAYADYLPTLEYWDW